MTNQNLYKIISLNLVLAFLYALTGKLSTIIFVSEKIVTFSVFPPEGIALAFALYFGKAVVPGIFIGQTILALINHLNFTQAIGIGVINSIEALIAIYLWSKFNLSTSLKNFKDFFALLGMIMFILQPFSAILSNIILSINSYFDLTHVFYWWIGNVLGQILFTPFLLILFNNFKKETIKKFFINGLIFSFIIYLFIFVLNIKSVFVLLIVSSSLILYFLLKDGLLQGLFLNIVLYYEILIAIIYKKNIFSTYSNFENALSFDLFIIYHTVLIYMIGILFEKEKNYSKELQQTIKKVEEENKRQFEYILEQKNLIAKADMLKMLSHQWRQPLNNILLLNELILTKFKNDSLSLNELENYKNKIKNEVLFLDNTIEEINSLSNELGKEYFSIKEAVNKILNSLSSKFEGITLYLELNDFEIYFNKDAFYQIVSAILQNAIEAVKNKENKQIDIKTFKEAEKIILIIKDNGDGIEEIDKIFEPYYSTKSKNKKGMSLFIVKTLLDKLGAKIEVTNENGAVFKIIFKGKV